MSAADTAAQASAQGAAPGPAQGLIPATILTGFLGSGKTTLLKRVLTEAHGQKIAVIENEFGEENIDNDILVSETQEQIIQLSNGCVCCTIREDLRTTLADLAAKRRKGELDFERVVIETTGLADPGPVAQTFFMDDEIAETFLLDSILTLVDAKHAHDQLDTRQEARRQVGFADQIFLSKTDLVDAAAVDALSHRLKHMNPRAPQSKAHFGEVPIKDVFDLRGFNLNAKLEIDPDFLAADEHDHGHDHAHGHDHGHEHHDHEHGEHCDHPHHHHHDDDVKSFVFRSERPFNPAKLEDFLGAIVQVYGPKMLRYKGVLNMNGTDKKVIFQGVHQLMGSDLGPKWMPNEKKVSKMVFIGIDLPKDILLQGLEGCLA
ncbi:GTP-binding protein [Mitsuaria sp. GD03876]|uniref:CobW family GTP-binding protein n=1 Tax=Mitsuaria sp. GD03876 TaxID=2975399 RepID=UPI00244B9E2A|nr:GTP-binding protein [Mitsuaria sp. GD03876]MDH0866411.1 GTP-binding protein [Mitsuaria sp. GD03876]